MSGLLPANRLAALRAEFPILKQQVHGHRLVYLDHAASTQRPQCVLDAVRHFDTVCNANVHRGLHHLSELATEAYEGARARIAKAVNAPSERSVVFVRGATEALNLAAHGLSHTVLQAGDEVVLTTMEHHANIVPWQMVAERVGCHLRVVPVLPSGALDLEAFEQALTPRTRVVGVVHTSNVLGTINPVTTIAERAHAVGACVVLDATQALPHGPVDMQALGCDVLVGSSHKMYGPMGCGILCAHPDRMADWPPYQGGGDMIAWVSFEEGSTYQEPPHRFEAGTPYVSGAVGMAAAFDALERWGWEAIQGHEQALLAVLRDGLRALPGVRVLGHGEGVPTASVVSFEVEGVHPSDVATLLDQLGVAVRSGHHCAMPLMEALGCQGTVRASLGVINGQDDLDVFFSALERVRAMLA